MENPTRVDVHVHIIALDERTHGAVFGRRLRRNVIFRLFALRYGYLDGNDEAFDRRYLKRLVEDIRSADGVDRAVALAMDGVYDAAGRLDTARTQAYVSNDYVFAACREHPELIPGPSVNPDRADALDELERCRGNGAGLIKWLPNTMRFDPMDSKYVSFYQKLAALRLPLLSHTGYEHCVPGADQTLGHPERLRRALAEGVVVIAGHAGATGRGHKEEWIDDFLNMLLDNPNLYADISAFTGPTRFSYLKKLVSDDRFHSRLLQGTDYPAPPIPWLFAGTLPPGVMLRAQRQPNVFTRDIALKKALGAPDCVFTNWRKISPV